MTWTSARIADVVEDAKTGFACGEDPSDGVFQIRMNNVTADGSLDLSKKRRVPASTRNLASYFLRTGDVLFNATNSPELVGKSAFFSGIDEPAVFSNHFIRLRPTSRIDGRFLARWLKLQFQARRFESMCRQWVNQATVSKDTLLNLTLPVPPLAEQQRIANMLDGADVLRNKRRASLGQLDTLIESIYLDMFGDPIGNPKHYLQRSLLDLIDPARPITYGILMPGPDQDNGVSYVRVVDMVDGGIDLRSIRRTTEAISNSYRRSILAAGDLLISIRGHVGRLAVVPQELSGANITQDTARLAVKDAEPIFVRDCLRSSPSQLWMARHIKGAAVRGINLGDLKRLPVIVPPLKEQKSFSDRAMQVDDLRVQQRLSLSRFDALSSSLQQRAFRGEL